MKRILLSAALLLAVGAFVVIATGATSSTSTAGTYKIEFDNAFGLVTGADFKVAGVPAGKIEKIDLDPGCISGDPTKCRALVTVSVTQTGFGPFRSDAFCQSRPQSLIGEYFVDCEPGQHGKILPPGSTIPVQNTQSTIPGDLLQDVMRLPYRERFTLIINELGAAAAARSGDLQAALQRAVPALTQTDNLLSLLANDSHTLQQLTVNADSVITALANNSASVQRFITTANTTAQATATQQNNLRLTFQNLPGLLEQLRPAMAHLGAAADANDPALSNLTRASAQLDRFFSDLPGFAHASIPALKALGKASVTGKQAVSAATPTVADLNRFATPTPELSQNLAIVLHDLDDRSRAVEPDARSPGGKGFTGLEALLQYVFNQPLAINGFTDFGHQLAVDAFVDPRCAPYATAQSIANALAAYGPSYRQCYAWLGPNQPGINETDPSDPTACVPDPGGAPPGEPGPKTTACKLPANGPPGLPQAKTATTVETSHHTSEATKARGAPVSASGGSRSTSSQGTSGGGGPVSSLSQTIGAIIGAVGTAAGSASSQINAATAGTGSSAASSGGSSSASGSAGNQTQQLLNYLLAP